MSKEKDIQVTEDQPGRLDLGNGLAVVRRPVRGRGTGTRLIVAYRAPTGGREIFLPLAILKAAARAADTLRERGLTRGGDLAKAVPRGIYEPPQVGLGLDPDEDII